MSYKETLLTLIGDLEDDCLTLKDVDRQLLAYYYQLLANEWYEEHFYKDVEYHPDQKKPFKRLTDTG